MNNFVSNMVMSLDEQIVGLRSIIAKAEQALVETIAKRDGSPEMQAYRAAECTANEYLQTMSVEYDYGDSQSPIYDRNELRELDRLTEIRDELYGNLTTEEQDSLGLGI